MANCFCLKWRPDVVKALDFRHCSLIFIPEEVFEYGETLEELYLDSNDIKDLPRPLFHCQLLKKLGASDNELYTVPPAIGSLINLKELDLSKNGIVSLPDGISGCIELDMIEISVNPLGSLPEGFTQLLNLTQLFLNDTLLNYLPANIGRLSKLKVLELRENKLKALPRSICNMTELERLDLGQNAFQELPDVIGSLSSLQELWIDANRVTLIHQSIGCLSKLFYFDACRNRIEELPETIAGWERIKDIHLSKNFIQKLPDNIGKLSTLSTLRVDNNQISSLPCSIGGMVSLEELILNANDLEELPPSIGILHKLKHLNIDDNMLMSLPPELGSCAKISLLSLRGNYLETLPDEVSRISSLTVANLSNNRLKYLPYNFTKLKKVQALWLSENQSKPLIPLQAELEATTGKRVLTCYLLPQQPLDDVKYDDSDSESFHMSVWSQQRRERMKIAFDVSESDPDTSPVKKHAYPKEVFRPKYRGGPYSHLSHGDVPARYNGSNESQERVQGRRALADDSSISGSVRSTRSKSPESMSAFSDSHFLFKADKERRTRDKERLRRTSSKEETRDDLHVQWELPKATSTNVRERKRRGSGKLIIRERNVHSDTEVMESHPMKVRSPRSEKKRLSKQHFDEADKEVAELTESFRRAFLLEQKSHTDTELFNKNDMPDVVFQHGSVRRNLVRHSASMDFDSRTAGQITRDSPSVVHRSGLRRSSPVQGQMKMTNRARTPDGHVLHSDGRIPNGRVPNGRVPDGSVPNGKVLGQTPKMRVKDSGPGRRVGSPMLQKGAPTPERLISGGLNDGLVGDGSPSGQHNSSKTGSFGPGRSVSTSERPSSILGDSLKGDGVPAVQHVNLSQHEGRDSGISGVSVQSAPVSDVELNGLYDMRYSRGPAGPYGGYDPDGQGEQPLGGNSVGRKEEVGDGYRYDVQSNVQGRTYNGNQNVVNRFPQGRTNAEGRYEANQDQGVAPSENSRTSVGGDISQGGQEWGYNVRTEAVERLAPDSSRGLDHSSGGGGTSSFSPGHTTSFTPTSVGRNTHSLIQMSRSQSRPGRGSETSRHGRGANSQRDQDQPSWCTPWDPKDSPSCPETRELRTSVPASGDYSDQLRRASSRLLPGEQSQPSRMGTPSMSDQAQSQPYTRTPSLSYQDSSSAVETSTTKGPRRHLRFSSANQTIIDHQRKSLEQSERLPRNSPSIITSQRLGNSHSTEVPRSRGMVAAGDSGATKRFQEDSPNTGQLHGGITNSVHLAGNYNSQSQDSGRQHSSAAAQPYTGTPSLSYQDPPSTIENSDLKGTRRHLRFSSQNQTIIERSRLVDQSNSQSGDSRLDNSHAPRDSLPNRTNVSMGSSMANYGESTLNDPTLSLSLQERTARSSHVPEAETSHHRDSHGNGNDSQRYQERPVDVPPEFIAADQRRTNARLSQMPTPSIHQFQSIPRSNYSTPQTSIPGSQTDSSQLSSGRPFSSPRLSKSLPMDPQSHDHGGRGSYEPPSTDGQSAAVVSGQESRDSGLMWAIPTWIDGESESSGNRGSYVTDVNRNVDKDVMIGRDDQKRPAMIGAERGSNGGGLVTRPHPAVMYRNGLQRDMPPDPVGQDSAGSTVMRGNINKQNWKSHLVDHLQKHRHLPPVQQPHIGDQRFYAGKNSPQTHMQSHENPAVFQHSSMPHPQHSYHSSVRSANTMPPSITRRTLPVMPSENLNEDLRRVTPPGSSGSSTNDSFSKTAPPQTVLRTTPYGHQGKPAPPRTAPQRTLQDRNDGQWF